MLSGQGFIRLDEEEAGNGGRPRRSVTCGGLVLPLGVALHRATVCTLAVALLWCTSLAVSRRIANSFVTSPSFATVTRECQRTYDEVHRQREAHLECTERKGANAAASAPPLLLWPMMTPPLTPPLTPGLSPPPPPPLISASRSA